MARPTKQGIDYFPLDCQFDDKIEMYLIEKESNGLAVLISIWQIIYSNEGYYTTNGNDLLLLVKKRINVGINDVKECINVCLDRNIFDKKLHKKYKILTSKAIQKRYFDASKKKKLVQYDVNYIINGVDVSDNCINVCGNATNVKEDVKEDVNIKLSRMLLELIMERNPNVRQPDLQSWAKHIDLMLRVDKRTPEEIEGCIRWSQKDSFWQNNILSTSKLRDKFDQLFLKAKNGTDKRSNGTITIDEYKAIRNDIAEEFKGN